MADIKTLGADARFTALGVFTADDGDRRIVLERLELDNLEGDLGTARYRANDLAVDGLETWLGNVQTNADALTLGGVELETSDGALRLEVDRVGFPRGFAFTRDTELFAPHASFEDISFAVADVSALFARRRKAAAPGEPADARPDDADDARPRGVAGYRFLDALEGHLNVDLVVDLTLPWVGRRKATHYLRIPIVDGTIDFEELEDDVNWLENLFLDIEVVDDKLVLERDLPLVPFYGKALMWWKLEPEDVALAKYRRVHLRNLINFEFPSSDRASKPDKPKGKSKLVLHELGFANCSLALATSKPAQIELAGGALIQLGGEEQTGLSDLSLEGAVRYRRDGEPAETALSGRVGQLDATLVDVPMASVTVSADRLHVSALEGLKLTFDGPRPRRLTGTISRLAATNLRVRFPGAPSKSPPAEPPDEA